VSTAHAQATLPRGLLIAQAWSTLGDTVAALSNAAGRPLARTVKLILEPLVLRPMLNPEFASGAIGIEHVDALRARIVQAGPVLAATAAWFQVLKKERRRSGITEGNPQDLYFQRCFELATQYGHPRPDRAAAVLQEIHRKDGPTLTQLRDFIAGHAEQLAMLLDSTWSAVPAIPPSPVDAQACLQDHRLFDAMVKDSAGTHGAAGLDQPGTAQTYGLTDLIRPERPVLGSSASKKTLPKPFDRSIVERLFGPLTNAVVRDDLADVATLVRHEIARSAGAWQLAGEPGRVVMVLGRAASRSLTGGPAEGAAARLKVRWEREAYVHKVFRMPSAVPESVRADVHGVRAAYLRRLWVRLHGRELRRETVVAEELWDMLDGVLRSVILDQRDRLKSALERRAL
jgi:hypothetical protein